MRASWSADIIFNLVTIPVIAYKAISEKKGLNLTQIHREDGGRITTVKRCKLCNQELTSKDIVKAYNISGSSYIPIEQEELNDIKKKAEAKIIKIKYFSDITTVSPLLFDKTFYLAPKKGYERHFSLFFEVLRKANKMGVGEIVLRGKEKVVGVFPGKSHLLLYTFYYVDEVNDAPKVALGKISKEEIDLATLLVDNLTRKFDPGKFENTYTQRFEQLLKEKIESPSKPSPRKRGRKKAQEKADALLAALTQSVKTLSKEV